MMDIQDLAKWLSERLDKLEDKMDATNNHCAEIDKTQTSMSKDLAYHIHRTDLLEEKVDMEAARNNKRISPLTRAYERGRGILWLVSIGSVVVGIVASVSRFMG